MPMAETITFYMLGGLILLFAVLVVSTRNTVHGIIFLVITLSFVVPFLRLIALTYFTLVFEYCL